MSEQPAIRTDRLTKQFGAFTAVCDLDLEVEIGEVFGFLGPNGAGKSTTIRTLLDQIRPTSGRARILGMDSHKDSLKIRSAIGYVPGDLALYPKLTGSETLRYFARLRGGVDQKYVDQLAERLQADLSKKVGDYSTGNRQKIGLIQAFMHKPDLLILDEPTAGLDPLVQREFNTMLHEVREEGRTVFLSSHTLSEVERVAGRVGIIREGRLVAVERIADLQAKAIRRLDIEFAEPVSPELFAQVDTVREVTVDGTHATVAFDGPINGILAAAMAHELVDLHTRDADLEEIFLAYYRGSSEDSEDGAKKDPSDVH
ncbi:ABC transporter ATP-binding protein [Rhodococcus sp. 1168]|uniref:ABC transporter ATP-binding protein n=1 Tax=Rhodococcus sp. 1168 TaxID=2018041 RepID=UPI000A0BCAE3|nr:ABC transporter ATP-binding protein [Rhodococcus sp. 1168]ORI20653.1 ABC transporter [Rhodococcus sp. 1168]